MRMLQPANSGYREVAANRPSLIARVGNMGSDLRFDYLVLGDSVNLASRLEGQTKNYRVPIIIGARTAQAVKDKFALLEVDFITVKGKTEPEVSTRCSAAATLPTPTNTASCTR
jgi:class 3 adenylate cyclase